jgi:hypothetical protein
VFLLLWDAGALAQRYAPELGSPTVNALFAAVARAQMVTTVLSYSETYAALLRKLNRGDLDQAAFTMARSALRAEVIDDPDFGVLGVAFDDILDGIDLVNRHNLNAADASILMAYLNYASQQPSPTDVSVLVAADRRMVRAALAEQMQTLNPELLSAADVPTFLASL